MESDSYHIAIIAIPSSISHRDDAQEKEDEVDTEVSVCLIFSDSYQYGLLTKCGLNRVWIIGQSVIPNAHRARV